MQELLLLWMCTAEVPPSPVMDKDRPLCQVMPCCTIRVDRPFIMLICPSDRTGCLLRTVEHRPLPVPMPARPSTSGGPNEKVSAFLGLNSNSTSADRRISRDDMSLPSTTRPKKGLQPYRIGITRSDGLPTADVSLARKYPSRSPSTSISTAMANQGPTGPGIVPIGMALGSPAHPPEVYPTQWQPQARPALRPLTPPALSYPAAVPTVQRQKSQRRKLFGGLFGSRKPLEQTKPSPDPGGSTNSLSTVTSSVNRYQENVPARSNTVGDRKSSKHKPIMTRANSEPVADSPLPRSRGSAARKTKGWRPLIPEETEANTNNY
jgi:hypothetical protein